MNRDEEFFKDAVKGARLLGHPIPTLSYGCEEAYKVSFSQHDGSKSYSFSDTLTGTITSVVTFPNSYSYRVDFLEISDKLKGQGWSNAAINMARHAGHFSIWVTPKGSEL